MSLSNFSIRQFTTRKDYSTLDNFIVSPVIFYIFAISRALVAMVLVFVLGKIWEGIKFGVCWMAFLLLSSLVFPLRKKMASSATGKSNTNFVLGIRI